VTPSRTGSAHFRVVACLDAVVVECVLDCFPSGRESLGAPRCAESSRTQIGAKENLGIGGKLEIGPEQEDG
jgi:hypothetical protein